MTGKWHPCEDDASGGDANDERAFFYFELGIETGMNYDGRHRYPYTCEMGSRGKTVEEELRVLLGRGEP